MRNIRQINIKHRTYFFLHDMINLKDFDSSLLKIDKKSHKNIGIYNIGYITIKKIDDYENIHNVNPLYLIIAKVIGHIECNFDEINKENKYLVFVSTNENQEVLKKYAELWDGIKNELKTINGCKKGTYDRDFMKIKFDSDDDLPLKKQLNFPTKTIVIRSVFEDEGKFYQQIYLHQCSYEL